MRTIIVSHGGRRHRLRRRLGHSHHRLFDDRKVDQRGQHPQQDGQPPHRVVGAGALKNEAAKPDAEEAAHLVAKEGEAASMVSQRVPNIKRSARWLAVRWKATSVP